MANQYKGTTNDFEKKLSRVMDRLGVSRYQYDWQSSKADVVVYVEMSYNGKTYRFENSKTKSQKCGRKLSTISDLLASIVYSLEGLARAVEQGIFTLDMLLTGVPSLPAAVQMEPCFVALGFSEMPKDMAAVHAQYRRLVKVTHPDAGGDAAAFRALQQNYEECKAFMEGEARN